MMQNRSLIAGIILLWSVTFLLVTAAFPWRGVPELYHSGVFLLLGAATAFSALAVWKRKHFRFHWGSVLLHSAIFIIVLGAVIGFFTAQKITVYVLADPSAPMADFLPLDEKDQTIPLDFSFNAGALEIDYYKPDYLLYCRQAENPDKMELQKKLSWQNDRLVISENQVLEKSDLLDAHGNFLPHLPLGEDSILMRQKPAVKEYRIPIRYQDNSDSRIHTTVCKVNSPVSIHSWRFYLISQGSSPHGDYVELLAKRDPGRLVVIAGLWMLLLSPFWILTDKKRRERSNNQ